MTTTSIQPAACSADSARRFRMRNPLSAFSEFPKAIWVVFAGTVVNRIGFLVGPFLVFFLGSRGVSTATMVGPAAYATLSDTVDSGRRREAFALFGWAINIGTAIAGVLGGYLAAHGYWMLFALDAGTSLAYALIVVALLPSDRAARIAASPQDSSSGYGVVFRDRLMLKLLPLFGIQLFIYSLTESALPLAIRTDSLSPSVMGTAAAVNAGIVVAFQPLATSYLSRIRRTPLYAAASILIAIGVALTGLAHSPWQYAATVTIWSLGEVAAGGIAATMIADLAPDTARARYQGAFSWTWGLARFLALTAGTTVYTRVGPSYLWWSTLAAGLAAIARIATLGPAVDRRTEARR